eukprot:1199991-Prymnesium_polylepis.1
MVHVRLEAAATRLLEVAERRLGAADARHDPVLREHRVEPQLELWLDRPEDAHAVLGGLEPLGGAQVEVAPLLKRQRVVRDLAARPVAEAVDRIGLVVVHRAALVGDARVAPEPERVLSLEREQLRARGWADLMSCGRAAAQREGGRVATRA